MPDSIPYLSNIISALAAGAIGAGASRHMTRRLPGEDENTYRKRLALNTGIGALGGAATGAALPTIAGGMSSMFGSEAASNNPAKWIGRGVGGAVDGANELIGPLGVAGAGAGAYLGDRAVVRGHKDNLTELKGSTEVAQKALDSALKSRDLAGKVPGAPASVVSSADAHLASREAAHADALSKFETASNAGPNRVRGRLAGGLGGMLGGMTIQGLLSKYVP